MNQLSNTTVPWVGTSNVGQSLREQVAAYMAGLDIQARSDQDADRVQRGASERFYKHWRVRPGVFATYADNDDVVEFGLSERIGTTLSNILHASLVLDDDRGELNVASESSVELNFDAVVEPGSTVALQLALRYFGEVYRGE